MADLKPVVDIDINEIFFRLHEIAKKQGEDTSKRLVISNMSVDEKGKTFESAQSDIRCTLKPENMNDLNLVNADKKQLDAFKQECFNAIQKYAEFFFGQKILISGKAKDLKSALAIDRLIPVYVQQPVKESKVDWRKPLLENLFVTEADDPVPGEGTPDGDSSGSTEPGGDTTAEPGASSEQTDAGKIMGYKFQYESEIAGQKKKDYANATAKFLKKAGGFLGKIGSGIFGNVIDDLKSAKLKTGLGDINVGDMLSKTVGLVGSLAKKLTSDILTGIDKDEFAANLLKTIAKDLPQSDITEVKAWRSDTLKTDLTKQKLLNTHIARALDDKNMRWPIVIVVPHESVDYPRINTEVIAKEISNTLGASQKVKQKILGLTNGLKDLTSNAAKLTTKGTAAATKWVGDKTGISDKVSNAKDKVSAVTDNISRKAKNAANTVGSAVDKAIAEADTSDLPPGEPTAEEQKAAEQAAKDADRVKQEADDMIRHLEGKPDDVMKGLYFIKDATSPYKHQTTYDKQLKSGLDGYLNVLQKKAKAVNEEETYSNPVVGSLIATLFEDDPVETKSADTPEPEAVPAEDNTSEPPSTESNDTDTGKSKEKDTPEQKQSAASEIAGILTDSKYKKESWFAALNQFGATAKGDSQLDIAKLNLSKPTKDGKTEKITDHKQLADRLIELLKSKTPALDIEKFLSQPSADKAQMSKLLERIKVLEGIISTAQKNTDSDTSGRTSDYYVYCNPYLKDKSGKE